MLRVRWPASFQALYGGEWPQNYCALDLETTGFSRKHDVITELGHVLVQDGKVVDRLSLLLDWTEHPIVPDSWLRQRLYELDRNMRCSGRNCHITYERMRAEGTQPDEALAFYRDFMDTLVEREVLFAAHGGYAFDEAMLNANFEGFGIAPGFRFGDNGLLDTDAIEKAIQYPEHPRFQPQPNDTLRSYFHRVRYTRIAGLKSNLDDHCFHKYRFDQRGVNPEQLHSAETDAFCVHLLIESYRKQLTIVPVERKPERDWTRMEELATVFEPAVPVTARAAPVLVSMPLRRRGQRRS